MSQSKHWYLCDYNIQISKVLCFLSKACSLLLYVICENKTLPFPACSNLKNIFLLRRTSKRLSEQSSCQYLLTVTWQYLPTTVWGKSLLPMLTKMREHSVIWEVIDRVCFIKRCTRNAFIQCSSLIRQSHIWFVSWNFQNVGPNIQSMYEYDEIFRPYNNKPLHFTASDPLWTTGYG